MTLIYSGKAKDILATDDDHQIIARYKDQVSMLNGARKDVISGKGRLNNLISGLIFDQLNQRGVKTHFIKNLSETEQLNEKVDILPLEVVVRNRVAGSFAKRFGLAEGNDLPQPILEFYYKKDELDDPFINEDHIRFLGIASPEEVEQLKDQALTINGILKEIFAGIDLSLVDFKLEFGRNQAGQLVLADEVSPDTCRLWDAEGNHLDKDVFRRDLGDIIAVYQQVLDKLEGAYGTHG